MSRQFKGFEPHQKSAGFSLLEVLISVLVLAVGLLGLLNLQMSSLKNNHSAQMRTTASILAYDIIDHIRLNKSADYTLTMSSTPSGSTTKDTDLIAWMTDISTMLPSGDGSVEVNGDIITVTIQWDDSRASGDSQQQFTVSSQP